MPGVVKSFEGNWACPYHSFDDGGQAELTGGSVNQDIKTSELVTDLSASRGRRGFARG